MLHCHESDSLLFLASPLVDGLEALTSRGLFISDIPIHDATRDVILIGEQSRAQVLQWEFQFSRACYLENLITLRALPNKAVTLPSLIISICIQKTCMGLRLNAIVFLESSKFSQIYYTLDWPHFDLIRGQVVID